MPKPIQFVEQGFKPIEDLGQGEAYDLFNQALEIANKTLDGESVVFVQQLSPQPPIALEFLDVEYNMLLGIQKNSGLERIDMIDMKALDEKTVKSAEDLGKEIVQKVRQHLEAKKTDGIVFSSSGSKFDVRQLEGYHLSIEDDFLLINGHRLAVQTEKGYWVPKALVFRSYTIVRWINEGGKIWAFDDYDLVRKNKLGMYIDASKVNQLAVEQLTEGSQREARDDENGYFLIKREELSRETRERLYAILSRIRDP